MASARSIMSVVLLRLRIAAVGATSLPSVRPLSHREIENGAGMFEQGRDHGCGRLHRGTGVRASSCVLPLPVVVVLLVRMGAWFGSISIMTTVSLIRTRFARG